jgi:hydroxyacylglutathione hydrolase
MIKNQPSNEIAFHVTTRGALEVVMIHTRVDPSVFRVNDNYAFLIHNAVTGSTTLIDAPEAAPIMTVLKDRRWGLEHIVITHHHNDHVDGLAELVAAFGSKVVGNAADAHRLPPLDIAVNAGAEIMLSDTPCHIIDVPGHTVGHIAIHAPDAECVFTADSLMTLGCGRLFEGTPAQMWDSMQRLRALPDHTWVCSGHEYTQANLAFALTIEPENEALHALAERVGAKRAKGLPTVPSRLSEEKETNPYLRADLQVLARAINMSGAAAADVFAEVRQRKDNF